VNDEFLYRLRQPPPAAFAARLRGRLESQALIRLLRRRQIMLYSLIACLLGGTAVALVIPGMREATSAMIREVLPGSLQKAPEPGVQPQPAAAPPMVHPPSEPASTAQPAASSPPAVTNFAVFSGPGSTRSVQPAPAPVNATGVTYIARGTGAMPIPSVESRPMAQITVIGHAQAAEALYGASTEFQSLNRDVRIGLVLTTNNKVFSRFCAGEGDIAAATRMITPSELESCRRSGSEVTALPIAYEALVVLANSLNDWVSGLRREDLKLLFDSSTDPNTLTWNQVDARWPAAIVEPAAPPPRTNFAHTFRELILRVTLAERPASGAFTSNDEIRLVRRVQRTLNGLTYLPYSVYLEFQQRPAARLIPIVNASGVAVAPSRVSIVDGSYELARPVLLVVRGRADRQAGVEGFVGLVLTTAERRLAQLDFLPLSRAETELAVFVLRLDEAVPLDLSTQDALSARGILLQQLPTHRREQARLKLESN
jgi:phosphate transport system substrate-binding protein